MDVMARRRLATVWELKERKSLKFLFRQEGIEREGFVAYFNGQVVCYENVCRHIPITLDYGDGTFFNSEGNSFVCRTHGAVYEPLTGRCSSGPCAGAALKPIRIEVVKDEIWLEET